MSRRVNLPGAEELFRPTQAPPATQPGSPAETTRPDRDRTDPAAPETGADRAVDEPTADRGAASAKPATTSGTPGRKPSGRVKHDEKITVYVSREELLAVETARLTLRAEHDLAVDRGRIVRAALAAAVSDLEQHGGDCDLVRRLAQ